MNGFSAIIFSDVNGNFHLDTNSAFIHKSFNITGFCMIKNY
ncbi:Uncharacterized protein dnl_57650 [Desulfonema limicola]|uniref:Uncharacterized protein n=1 Tax=Desulfonema limicola TaxID=45656 RepID=A0A975BDK6_9BACT|nr:Uncharacterized protein dnl_57650 [Desulfonema limicola]